MISFGTSFAIILNIVTKSKELINKVTYDTDFSNHQGNDSSKDLLRHIHVFLEPTFRRWIMNRLKENVTILANRGHVQHKCAVVSYNVKMVRITRLLHVFNLYMLQIYTIVLGIYFNFPKINKFIISTNNVFKRNEQQAII